jgi:hypothetical protein
MKARPEVISNTKADPNSSSRVSGPSRHQAHAVSTQLLLLGTSKKIDSQAVEGLKGRRSMARSKTRWHKRPTSAKFQATVTFKGWVEM